MAVCKTCGKKILFFEQIDGDCIKCNYESLIPEDQAKVRQHLNQLQEEAKTDGALKSLFSVFAFIVGWLALAAGVIAALMSFAAATDAFGSQAQVLIVVGFGSLVAGAGGFLVFVGLGKVVDSLEAIRKELEKKV